jgi:cyclophilin family peptidyl-prolyl cis-trans isomerase
MKKHILAFTTSILLPALMCSASPAYAAKKKAVKAATPPPVVSVPAFKPYPSPPEIVAAAPASDWVAIAPSDLLVMDLAPDAKGKARRVVIQLMPAPFSQGWVGNIRKLAAAKFWDGTAIVRVQDNYVTQWGDPDGEDAVKAKKLPDGLEVVPESAYVSDITELPIDDPIVHGHVIRPWATIVSGEGGWLVPVTVSADLPKKRGKQQPQSTRYRNETYGWPTGFSDGWPVSGDLNARGFGKTGEIWPTHCYSMVGVGRNLSPDTGTGAELYTVIGHAPRHLDRNIALVGRIIEGMEHMSSLPRGTGALGFYETPEERTAILSVRLMSEMETDKPVPIFEYLSTESASFAKYADARANRRDPFFIKPAGGADICNIPVPVRRRK